jgi:hypothetical protein
MKKYLLVCVFAFMIGGMGFCGCSGTKEAAEVPPEKGAIREMTDQTAHEMVDHMQRPINKARDVKGLVEGQQAETYKDQ